MCFKNNEVVIQAMIAKKISNHMLSDNENQINILYGRAFDWMQIDNPWIPAMETHDFIRDSQIPSEHAALLVKLGKGPQTYQRYMNLYILDEKSIYDGSLDELLWGKQT